LGDIDIGHSQVVAPAPQLPVAEQRTQAGTRPGFGNSGAAVVPPPPSVGASGVSSSGGRLIALGIHPVAPGGPVQPPAGSRRGSFAATPQGKAGAPGTPDLAGGGNQTASGASSANRTDIPSGLHVGSGPSSANHSGGAGNGKGDGTGGAQSNSPVQMAKVTPPRVGGISPSSATEVAGNRATDAEKEVFGDRKFYGMTLSVPNLNSAGGSWVVHFAELHVSADMPGQGDLVAPAAVAEADPAYPLELMKQNIEGKVTLYAVIRSDGSVSDVRVLRSVDDRLDQYACDALARWRFRPATKNGSAVDLEAVVTIPFRPSRSRSSF
jgi:TonB family protein